MSSATSSNFVIAIDGPAAAGKGTLSAQIAKHYGFNHLDTGLSYRAVAKAMLDQNIDLDDVAAAENIAANIDLSNMERSVLAVHEVGNAASKIAVMTGVRKLLVDAQRRFATKTPGVVLDGRDIGTVVCPNAHVKLYVTASAEVRATRRHKEALSKGNSTPYAQILQDVLERDARDSGRKDSPMRKADDALLLDTSKMSIEAAFNTAKSVIDAALDT